MDNKLLGPSLGISQGLIKRLNELYPDKLPPFGTTPAELTYCQGQRSVVEKLIELSEDDFITEE